MTDMSTETSRLDPEPVGVALSNHRSVNLQRLRTRQLFKLLKIVTRGAGPGIINLLRLDTLTPENAGEFGMQLAVVVFMSVPEAENETMAFLASMVEPAGLYTKAKLNKQEQEHNEALWRDLEAFLANPPIDDTFAIIEAVFRQEAPELASLGKRIAQMLNLAGLTGQDKKETPETPPGPQELAEMEGTPVSEASSPAPPWAEPSPSPTTSYPASTDGTTPPSGTSTSAGSGKSLTSSPDGRSGSSGALSG